MIHIQKRIYFYALIFTSSLADARVVRVEAQAPQILPEHAGKPIYERIDGVFHGELDPRDPANRIITDLAAAPRNARGKVEYRASFSLSRAVDPAKRSGVIFYDVPNRGFAPAQGVDEDGHIRVVSGWQGDVAPSKDVQWLSVPTVKGITGPQVIYLTKLPATTKSRALGAGQIRPTLRPEPVSLDTRKAKLVISRRGQGDVAIAPEDWAFADCTTTPFPGVPHTNQICLRNGFDEDAAYTLSYTGKDPQVLGIGFAATRDLMAFLRSGKPDDTGNANPAGNGTKWTVGVGNSQSGNFLRSFVHLGFNRDEQGRKVFDGINPNIAARQLVLNLRFNNPGGAVGLYEPGSEGTLWWGRYTDKARGRGPSSLLDRCHATKTCPKIIETFGSAELWGLRASPGLVGTDAKADIPLPANVRRYYFPSTTHGGSWRGGFPVNGEDLFMGATCLHRGNPNPISDQLRVARKMLVNWVSRNQPPLASRYPTLANGDLVQPNGKAMGFDVRGLTGPDGHIKPFYDYDFGPGFIAADVSGALSTQPPRVRGEFPQRVPRVNADFNEFAGVPSVHLQVPLGTYTGWNIETKGYEKGQVCGFVGGFIPFAKTKAEREAQSDPRLSLEERYKDHAGFVAKVREAAAREIAAGWLLADDAARIVKQAEDSAVLK